MSKNEPTHKSRALVAHDPTASLVFYTSAKQALAKAHKIDEVRPIREKARALEVYAAQARDHEMQRQAWEVRMRAERRAGEILKEMERRGERDSGKGNRNPSLKSSLSIPKLFDLGISKDESARWQALAGPSDEEFDKTLEKIGTETGGILAGAPVLRELRREAYEEAAERLKTNPPKLPEGKYNVIVADPPWATGEPGRTQGIGGESGVNKGRRKGADGGMAYTTMELPEINAQIVELIGKAAMPDCHVFLWTTEAFLPGAFRILENCGLVYRFTQVWKKPGGPQPIGYPQYNCEFIVCATQGKPKFVDTRDFWTCFEARRGEHSEKPERFYEMLRRVTVGRRLDAYNRRPIEGFERWGSETSNSKRAA